MLLSKPEKTLSGTCPFCHGDLEVTHLRCTSCEAQLSTNLAVPVFFRLPADLQQFVLIFLRNRGNIREVGKELGISYPTVCKRLDRVNELLGQGEPDAEPRKPAPLTRDAILSRVEKGTLTAREAAQLLKNLP